MADRYMQLYNNAQDMRAMLQPECAYALQSILIINHCFQGLGEQVLHSLCMNGVTTSTGHQLYEYR